jgi:hypothetical protein
LAQSACPVASGAWMRLGLAANDGAPWNNTSVF